MNKRNFLNTGDMIIGKVITADRLGYPSSTEELTQILRTFNYKDILVTLSRINLLFHRGTNLSESDKILQGAYCAPIMINAIDASRELREGFLFNRQATLSLLDKCAYVSDSSSTRSFDSIADRNELAKAFLIANGLLDTGSSTRNMTVDEGKKDLLVKSFAFMEYSVNESAAYETKKLMVRGEEFLRRLQEHTSELNVDEIFSQVTGLTLQDYQRLIFGIFAFYWSFTSDEIGRQDPITDRSLFFNPNGQSPELTPLYQRLLPHISVSMDELENRAEERPQFEDEFFLWRKYPLLKISEDRTICVDLSFLLEKLQTGVFWAIRDRLKESREKGIFERLWGDIFEGYTASIIERGVNTQNPSTQDKLLIKPEYNRKQRGECSDVALYNDDTLILIECKATVLSSHAKFSGDFDTFYDNIKPAKNGIKQLWNAIRRLGSIHNSERLVVKEIDICKVKKIYPVLVLSDQIFSTLLMNWFLDSEFQSLKQQDCLMEDLKVMPLTVLTIMDLESLEPYMIDKPFHAHLDEWLNQFKENDVSGFRSYLRRMMMSDPREHTFMDQRFAQITPDVQGYFSSRGIS